MNSLIDKKIIIQIFGSLMSKPSLMSETDKYNLVLEDFDTTFERYIYASIYNLYLNGAESIMPQDIDTYLSDKPNCYSIFEKEKGITFLQDALELAQPDNFDYYYNKFKKLKLIEDFKRAGYPTNNIYCEDLFSDDAQRINEKFEESSIKDILNIFSKRISILEEKYKVNQENKSHSIADGLNSLISKLDISPDVGNKLQGNIFNSLVRGARIGKYYVRSLASGGGKTRRMVGDICYLAFPYRFNSNINSWEITGSCEPCLYFATEQELEEIQTMVIAYISDIDEDIILNGNYTQEIKDRLEFAVEVINKYQNNFVVVHMPNPTIEQVRTKVRYHYFKDNIRYLFYDYIFSSTGLLNEYRDLKVREDVILNIFSTALKDLAVELGLFVMTATQLNDPNSDAGKRKEIKNQALIRGSKAILDKADVGCIGSLVTNEELELLKPLIEKYQLVPNQVTDLYKNRGNKYVNVRIWSYVNLGTCRTTDLFITYPNFREILDFEVINYHFEDQNIENYNEEINEVNKQYIEKLNHLKIDSNGEVIQEENNIDWSALF